MYLIHLPDYLSEFRNRCYHFETFDEAVNILYNILEDARYDSKEMMVKFDTLEGIFDNTGACVTKILLEKPE